MRQSGFGQPRARVIVAGERVGAVVPVARAAAELGALPGYLLAPGPVPARGVAMVRQLLSDGSGPLYRESGQVGLADAARKAAAALAG